MLQIKFHVFPNPRHFPTMEVVHFEEDANLPECLDKPFRFRNELLIVRFRKRSSCFHDQNLSFGQFAKFERHVESPFPNVKRSD